MQNCREVRVVGGDARYTWAAEVLREHFGKIETWGVPGWENRLRTLEATLDGAHGVLFPLRPFREQGILIQGTWVSLDALADRMAPGGMILAGSIPPKFENELKTRGLSCLSYLDQPEYVIRNAAITAECALELAMEQLPRTLSGERVLVIGWGRIGRFLGEKLRALGAKVTISVRRQEQIPELEALGYRGDLTGEYRYGLEDYGLVFNTVPAAVMPQERTRELRGRVIELASLPGGFTPGQIASVPVLMAQGLPGKLAPETSGKLLAETVISALEEGWKWME